MIGAFVKTQDERVCFIGLDSEKLVISSFRYVSSTKIVTALFDNGTEESFTTPIADDIHPALIKSSDITIVRMGKDNIPAREYTAELSHA